MALYIYTDGSAKHNGKSDSIGGYGIVVTDGDGVVLDCFAETGLKNVTNNQMELTALLGAVVLYGAQTSKHVCYIHTDSEYANNTLTNWWMEWAQNDWKTSSGQPVKNKDIILQYIKLVYGGKLPGMNPWNWNIYYVKGHQGVFGNEVADRLATGELTCEEVMRRYGKKKAE